MDLNEKQVMDQYRRADFTRRLHIYLQFPQLRSDFLAIDGGDATRNRYRDDRHEDFSPATLALGLLRLPRVCLKRLAGIIYSQTSKIT